MKHKHIPIAAALVFILAAAVAFVRFLHGHGSANIVFVDTNT